MTVTDYQIVSGSTVEELQGKVKDLLLAGWQVKGGVLVNFVQQWPPRPLTNTNPPFLQTMVKYVP